jgi:acyl-coenzyme A synthetase/AMP-(fatty) acid ligase
MICCAYVLRTGDEVTLNTVREHLRSLIPSYMIPARWMAFDILPKNANGKIDRPRLKDLFTRAETGLTAAKPSSTTEVVDNSGTHTSQDTFHTPTT